MVFDDRHEENNDEDYVDRVSDLLAVWLKTPNSRFEGETSVKNTLLTINKNTASNCSALCLNTNGCLSFDYNHDKNSKEF